MAIVVLNGKNLLAREKEEIGEVRFLKFDKYNMTISLEQKKRVIRKAGN